MDARPRSGDVVRLRDSRFDDVQHLVAEARPSTADLTPLDVRLTAESSTGDPGDTIDDATAQRIECSAHPTTHTTS